MVQARSQAVNGSGVEKRIDIVLAGGFSFVRRSMEHLVFLAFLAFYGWPLKLIADFQNVIA